jgi:hypothetical protein
LPDQGDNLLQDEVLMRDGKPDRKCLCNKAADIPVNTIPAARSDMGTRSLQSGIFRHIASAFPENIIQDHGEVYDVTHHASNILLAAMRGLSQLLILLDVYSPPPIYIVNPNSEVVSRHVPVRTIGNSIRRTSLLIV